jgi:hypothetical protein
MTRLLTVAAGTVALIALLAIAPPKTTAAPPTATPAPAAKVQVPCSFRTPGLQYECVEKNGHLQPGGPAAARQTKHFDDCTARGRSGYKCLDEAARVK